MKTPVSRVFGNAVDASSDTRGWFLGHFMPSAHAGLRTPDVEMKWYVHAKGETRDEWAPAIQAKTLNVLIRGELVLVFPDGEAHLANEGDFVLFGPDVPHSYRSLEESLVLTVRWPSGPR